MKHRDVILMLVDKSINAFGQVFGITEEEKLKTALSITQSTIKDSFDIDSVGISKKTLADILAKGILDLEQAQQLTVLFWTQAEILIKLKRPQESLTQYKNALQLLQWKAQQSVEKGHLERKNKISELETIISKMKLAETNTIN